MTKKITRKIIALLLAVLMLIPSAAFADGAQAEPILTLAAVSDIHIDDLFNQTLIRNSIQFSKLLKETSGKDIFVVGGDMSSYGVKSTWFRIKRQIEKYDFGQIIWTLGNHEYGTTGLRRHVRSTFKKLAGTDTVNYIAKDDETGIHFIVLGAMHGLPFISDHYCDLQFKWLDAELALAVKEQNGKNLPIFVVSHYGIEEEKYAHKYDEVLSKYPNVILLWGHEHGKAYKDKDLDFLIQTREGSGHYKYTAARMGCTHIYSSNLSYALCADVYSDKVELTLQTITGTAVYGDENQVTVPLVHK